MRTTEIDMADSVHPADIDSFIDNAVWAIRSTYHTVLKASPGAAIFGRDMLFDIPFIADWKKIGEHRQLLTDRNTARENQGRINYDYQVGQKVLVIHAQKRSHNETPSRLSKVAVIILILKFYFSQF